MAKSACETASYRRWICQPCAVRFRTLPKTSGPACRTGISSNAVRKICAPSVAVHIYKNTSLRRQDMIRKTALAIVATALLNTLSMAQAQQAAFPQGPVRVIVPYEAGGSADILARAISDKLTQLWGQTVIV